ncbi:D-2-hydroxyacid dehydrogenase [Lonsdalea populi]|uniref:D-2-hydroxyacid dehydrogenase n=1 Tax=Lonsdalea populi TaxID=1172565 RepID=UPI000A25073C|nr:D-2-hydroxyacid dehydrogenase [Lonsdalea populi]OSM94302.1 hydroxyacid dehydrogenase [Lonsdalea populi]RAT70718.1 hydroxyacid dehydrogenase [Lonsdalea populi]RAT73249.1 hydroxyacid dehydrogenase [Lonsdalea populi]RAT75372.1 hydroxyacid dehydrogenase [Lonsdalea populi]RAT79091.1 hydroxyacid dehydrogenase [Lonsdalea populi]
MTSMLVLDSRADEIKRALRDVASDIELMVSDGTARQAAQYDIWVGEPKQVIGLLAQGVHPQWLQSTWAGFKPYLTEGLPRGYRLSRAVGVFGQPIAEYVLAYLLQHELHLEERRENQHQRRWQPRLPGSLAGRQVLIVGAGDIGSEVAAFLQPFGIELSGIVNTPRPLPYFKYVAGPDDLPSAVAGADYVINLLPDTARTTDIYNADLFAAMKSSALFINVGRGTAVVEDDLLSALHHGRIAGAVLDVYRQEPLPESHPFWRTPNLTLSPHVAGPMVTALLARLLVDNLSRFRAGESLRGEVVFTQEY